MSSKIITIKEHEKRKQREELDQKKKQREILKEIKMKEDAEKKQIKLEKQQLKEKELNFKQNINKKTRLDQSLEPVNDNFNKLRKLNDINVDNLDSITDRLSYMINIENKEISYEPKFEVLKNTDKVITKIIHIADIHIRLSSLHNEYNEVFERLYIEIKKIKEINENGLICLCGDLLQSKDELKPDTIITTWNFIKNLSDIYPLIIITGNHDTIELNNNKSDSITSILKDRPINNTYYLLNTGVYIYNNVIFGVSSIIDKYILSKEKFNNVLENSNYKLLYQKDVIKHIGLYHGALDNVLYNESDVRMRGKQLNEFNNLSKDNYDYILLGDIHKFQYLDEKKTIAYSSSLISQNFTESDDYHGFIEWSILTGQSEYHKIKNYNAYYKLNINKLYNDNDKIIQDENKIKECFRELMKMSEEEDDKMSGYVRIEYDENIKINLIKNNLICLINKIYPKIKITWHVQLSSNKNLVENDIEASNIAKNLLEVQGEKEQKIDNYQNDTYMEKLIKIFMKSRYYGLTDNIIENTIKYLNKIKEECKSVDNDIEYVQSDWKILFLSFDNMYGYGKNNIIDFTKYPDNEIIGIFGDNAVGKSSLIDIISYMLYSKSARDDVSENPKDIVNVREKKAQGIMIIESANKKYLIKRECERYRDYVRNCKLYTFRMEEIDDVKSKVNDTYIYNNKTYKLVSLTEENRMCTDKILVPIVGTYDNFITTSVLLQNNHKSFKSKTNVKKKEFLCEILKIDYFKKCEDIIVNRFKSLKQEYLHLKKISETYSNKTLEQLIEDNNIFESNMIINNDLLDKIERSINDNLNKIDKLSSELVKIENEKMMSDKLIESKIDELINNNKMYLLTISSNNEKILKTNELINSLKNVKDEKEIIDSYKMHIQKIDNTQKKLINMIDNLIEEKQKYKLIKINNGFSSINEINKKIDEISTKTVLYKENKNKIIILRKELADIIKLMININQKLVISDNLKIDDVEKIYNEKRISVSNNFELINDLKNNKILFEKNTDKLKLEIDKLSTIKFEKEIIKKYNDHIYTKSSKQKELLNLINIMNKEKQQYTFIHLETTMTQKEIIARRDDILVILNESSSLLDINIDDIVDKSNKLLELKYNYLAMSKEYSDNNVYQSDYDFIDDEKTLDYLNSKELIENNYNMFIESNNDLIYELLDKLELSINIVDKDKSLDIVKSLRDSIDIVLDKKGTDDHIVIKRYNEFNTFFEKYNIIKLKIDRKRRYDYIKQIIDTIDEEIENNKEIEELLKYYNDYDNILSVELDELNQIINNMKINNQNEKKINDIDKQINMYQTELNCLSNDDIDIIDDYNKLREEQSIFHNYNNELNDLNMRILKNDKNINELERINSGIIEEIKIYDESKESIILNIKNQQKIENIYDEIDDIKVINIDIESIEDVDNLLIKMELEINNLERDKTTYIEMIESIRLNEISLKSILDIDERINIMRVELNKINDPNNELIIRFKNLQEELIRLSEYNNELKLLDGMNEKTEKLIVDKNVELESLKKFRETVINNDLISEDIKNLKDINNEKNREIKEINGKILLDKNNYSNNLVLIEKIRENNKIADKLNEEIEIYEILNKLTSKDGVQLYLLSQSLDDITNKINNILEPFINKTVQIKLEGEKIELNVMSKDDNVIHSLSGMEGFLLDLSIRVIINNLSCMPKSNILFMDESISVLDKHRLASIEELFVFLRQYYRSVFLITHMKQVNNHINHSLEIIKYNDNSLIYNIDIKNKNTVLKLDDIEYILENNMDTNIDNNSIVVISDKNNKKLKSKSKVLNKSLVPNNKVI